MVLLRLSKHFCVAAGCFNNSNCSDNPNLTFQLSLCPMHMNSSLCGVFVYCTHMYMNSSLCGVFVYCTHMYMNSSLCGVFVYCTHMYMNSSLCGVFVYCTHMHMNSSLCGVLYIVHTCTCTLHTVHIYTQ